MKKLFTTLFAFLFGTALFAQTTVTFNVDMSVQILKGTFNPSSDSVNVTGSFVDEVSSLGDWSEGLRMADDNGDSVYSFTATFADSLHGTAYEYKFRLSGAWEGSANKGFTLDSTNHAMDLPVAWYNNDSVYVFQKTITDTLIFAADLTDIAGTGAGFFDPSSDSIVVMGLDWDGLGTRVNHPYRAMKQDLFASGVVFKDTIIVKGFEGDSTKWKFKAYPDSKFENTGWETGGDRWHSYTANGAMVDLGTIVPRITALGGPIGQAQDVRFQMDLNQVVPGDVLNDSVEIPLGSIIFIGLKGSADELGAWGGSWTASDTTTGDMLAMHDDGTFGDSVAGDNIWTRLVTFADSTAEGNVEYKYGAHYVGNPSTSSPMDNENGFAKNHSFYLQSATSTIVLRDVWATEAVSGPVGPQVAAPAPTIPEAQVISLFSDVYTDEVVDTWSASWDQADLADVTVAGDSVKKYFNLSYAGIEFTSNTIDATGMTHFHMDVWTDDDVTDPKSFKIKLVDFGANGVWNGVGQVDDVEDELAFNSASNPPLTSGTWSSLDIPLDAFAKMTTRGHIAQLIISGDPNTVYVDNVFFWGPADTTTTVEFNVDMSVQILNGFFDPATDSVTVTGSFVDEVSSFGDWGNDLKMEDNDGDSVYTYDATFANSYAGTEFEYKYRMNGGWEGSPNKKFTLDPAVDPTVLFDWYNNDSVYVFKEVVTDTLIFVCDLTDIAGSGAGFFDPSTDSVMVYGLDWDGLGERVTHKAYSAMKQDLFASGVIYRDTIAVRGFAGDSTKWKYRTLPETKFENTGWESGSDRWHHYTATGEIVNTGTIVPRIGALQGPLGQTQDVRFQVDLNTKAPGNASFDKAPIPLADINFIGLTGAANELGAWGITWTPSDTTAGTMLATHDDGTFGDSTAGDNIWTRLVTFSDSTNSGNVEYKYGADYQNNPATSSPMDNEAGFGVNHMFNLHVASGTIILRDEWLTEAVTTEVDELAGMVPTEFTISQNYPNPFNPTTVIRYSIPKAAHVTLKVYNLLGEEVATLVNREQDARYYEVTFDASRLSSGLYFYTIQAGDFVATKKMMLLK